MSLSSLSAAENGFRRLWRRPRYPGFVLTVSLARTSSFMFNTAGVLLVLERTGSAPLAGITAAAAVVPSALTGPVLGAWLDVARRRRVLIVIDQLLSVVGLIGIVALAGHAPNWTVPAVTVAYSLTRPFSMGSFFSSLAEIAGPELLDHASAIEATSLNLAVIIGPALAGALAGIIGAAATVELQAGLTLLVAGLVAVNPAFEARAEERPPTVSNALRTGLRALSRERVLRATSVSSSLAAFGWGLMLVASRSTRCRCCTAPRTPAATLGGGGQAGPSWGRSYCTGRPDCAASACPTESSASRPCSGRWRARWSSASCSSGSPASSRARRTRARSRYASATPRRPAAPR